MVAGKNELSRPSETEILSKLLKEQTVDPDYKPFGDGHSSQRIVSAIEEYRGKENCK